MLTIDKLENIFQDFPVPALILAANDPFKILQANKAYMHKLALSPNDLYGRPLFEVFPDQQLEDPESPIKKTKHSIRQAIRLKEPQSPGTIPYKLPDDSGQRRLRFWMLEYIPVVDETGNVAYVFQLTHEVAKNQLAEQLKPVEIALPYEKIFETAQNAFFLSDKNGEILAANEAACTMFGYSEEELKQLHRNNIVVIDRALYRLLIQRKYDGKASGEITGINRSGERFPCQYSSVKFITSSGEERYCTEITDIRKWKNAEDKIHRSEENLRAIFDNTVEGFVLVNNELEIIAYNEKAGELIFEHSDQKPVMPGVSLLDYLAEERANIFRMVARRAFTGERIEYERAYPLKDGESCWFSFAVNPLSENGSVVGLCISGRDITRQKRAEEEVIRREKRFRRMVENNAAAIAILSAEGKVTYVSPAGEQITGYSQEELLQINIFDAIHPADREKSAEVTNQAFEQPGAPVNVPPVRLLHKDGASRWVEATITNLLDDPEVHGIIYNFRDVSKRIEAEEKLLAAKHEAEQSEEKYKKIFNLSPLPNWIYDMDTLRILEVNEMAIQHYGYSRQEFLSMTIADIRPPQDVNALIDIVHGVQQKEEKPYTYWRHIKKNGEIIIVDITGYSMDFYGPNARMIICRDVTENIKAEAELIRSNERFRQAARASSDAIWDWQIASDTVFLGEGFSTLFGYTEAGTSVQRSWLVEKVHPDDRLRVAGRINDILKGNRHGRWQDEYRLKKADGTYATICNSVVIVRDEEDNLSRAIGAMKDVTQQKEEEHHLKLMESVITNTTDAVIITATHFNNKGAPAVIYSNPAFHKITGYTAQEIKRDGLTLLHGPETDLTQIAKLEEAMKKKESCQIQAVFYKKTGQPYWASLAISPVTDAEGNLQNYIAIERDVTERMDYLTAIEDQNKQLREIAWLQSHMVRAPLARILGLIDLLVSDDAGTAAKDALPMLKKSADDLDKIVREVVGKTNCTHEDGVD